MFDGLMNGISGIASAGIQKWGAPSIAYCGTGSTGIQVLLGKYGSFEGTLGFLVKPSRLITYKEAYKSINELR